MDSKTYRNIVRLKQTLNMFKRPCRTVLIILVLWTVSAFLLGCGYRFRADGKPSGIDIPSLAIPLMESPSTALGFESDFTKTVRDEFISYADVPLVPREEAAMVLVGKISEISSEPLTYRITQTTVQGKTTNYEVTNSRRLIVRLDVKLIERATGKTIWADESMEDRALYPVTLDPLMNRYNQRKALQEIAGRLVDRIYLKTMERF